jgi:hypothetical protein
MQCLACGFAKPTDTPRTSLRRHGIGMSLFLEGVRLECPASGFAKPTDIPRISLRRHGIGIGMFLEGVRLECPNGAPHTSPGQRPGIKVPQNFGVLKERCIPLDRQRAGALCGVPSERIPFRVSPGFHPGLVCSAPLGHRASRSGVRILWAGMGCFVGAPSCVPLVRTRGAEGAGWG